MQLGIFAKTFPGTNPKDVLKQVRDAGYACVQYNMACSGLSALPQLISDAVVADVITAANETSVAISAVSATYNMIGFDHTKREAGRAAFSAIAAAAPKMGSRIVTLCTGSRDPSDQWRHHRDNQSPEAMHDFRRELDLLLPIAERHNIILGIEPEAGNVINNARTAHRLLAEAGSKHIGIILDPANLFEADTADQRDALINEAIALLGPHIVMAHAKDRDALGRVTTAGKGAVNFTKFFAQLHHAGFDGPVVTHGLEAAEAKDVAKYLQGQLDTLPPQPSSRRRPGSSL